MIDRIDIAANCIMAKVILESKPLLTQSEARTLTKVNNYWETFVAREKVE